MKSSNALWQAGQGYLDGPTSDGATPPVYTGGTPYVAKATSVRLAPNGQEKESIFVRLYFVATWSMECQVRLTPIVDGVVYDGTLGNPDLRVTLDLEEQDERATQRFLIDLVIPYMVGGIERTKTAMRGVWYQTQVETVGSLAPGDLIFEVSLLEHEPAESTLVASN